MKKKNFTKHKDWTNWWETLKIFLILSKVKTRFQALPKFCGVAKVDVNFGQRRLKRERSDELMFYQKTSDLMTVMDSYLEFSDKAYLRHRGHRELIKAIHSENCNEKGKCKPAAFEQILNRESAAK